MFEFKSNPLYNPLEDGITHINIYSKGKTQLGRLLSNFSHTPFTFEPYGTFESGEGFYYWYLTGQQYDKLKDMYGFLAKKEGMLHNDSRIDIIGLTTDDLNVLHQMLIHKVAYNQNIIELLKISTLPFSHYYSYNSNIIIPTEYDWLSDSYERIRAVLKNMI